MKKRMLSMLLALVMVIGMLPAVTPHVHAEETGTGHIVLTGPGGIVNPISSDPDCYEYSESLGMWLVNTNLLAYYLNEGGTYTLTTNGTSEVAVSLMVNTTEKITLVLDHVSFDVSTKPSRYWDYPMLNGATMDYQTSAIEIVQADYTSYDAVPAVDIKVKGTNTLEVAKAFLGGLFLNGVSAAISGVEGESANVLNINNPNEDASSNASIYQYFSFNSCGKRNVTIGDGVTVNLGGYETDENGDPIKCGTGLYLYGSLTVDKDAKLNINSSHYGSVLKNYGAEEKVLWIKDAVVNLQSTFAAFFVANAAGNMVFESGSEVNVTSIGEHALNQNGFRQGTDGNYITSGLYIGDNATVNLTSYASDQPAVYLNDDYGKNPVVIGRGAKVTITGNGVGDIYSNYRDAVWLGKCTGFTVGEGASVTVNANQAGMWFYSAGVPVTLEKDATLAINTSMVSPSESSVLEYGLAYASPLTVKEGASLQVNCAGNYAIYHATNMTNASTLKLYSSNVMIHGAVSAFYAPNKVILERGITPDGKIVTFHSDDTNTWEEKDSVNWTDFTENYTSKPWFMTGSVVHTHSWGDWEEDEATETHTRKCTVDGCTEEQTAKHEWDDGVQSGTPTCTEGAKTVYTCGDCGATYEEDVDNLGHDWSDWAYDSVDSHIRYCKRECGVEEEVGGHEWGDWVPVDDTTHKMVCDICSGEQTGEHDWDKGKVTAEPACADVGIKTYTCQTCSHTKTEEIPALGHSYKTTVIQAPTCSSVGQILKHCATCGDDQYVDMPIDPDAHEWSEWRVTERPTYTEDGEEQRICRLNRAHIQTREVGSLVCYHTCTACGNCTDEKCAKTPKCQCAAPVIIPTQDATVSFISSQPIAEDISIVAVEVILPSSTGETVSQEMVNPYEAFILNNAEGMKVETVFEIGLVNDATGAAYELEDGQSATVTLFVGAENAKAIEEGKMFLVHITGGTTVTYGADEIVAEMSGESYTGNITFSTDSFSPFVLVSLPGGLDITLNGVGTTNRCTVSISANQAYNCSLYLAVYDTYDKMLAVKVVDNCNLAATPQHTLEFSGTASYVKAFMMENDGSLAPRCASVTDDKLND